MPSQRCSPNCASKFGFAYHGFMSNQSYLEGYMHNGLSINHVTGFGTFLTPLPCFCEFFFKYGLFCKCGYFWRERGTFPPLSMSISFMDVP